MTFSPQLQRQRLLMVINYLGFMSNPCHLVLNGRGNEKNSGGKKVGKKALHIQMMVQMMYDDDTWMILTPKSEALFECKYLQNQPFLSHLLLRYNRLIHTVYSQLSTLPALHFLAPDTTAIVIGRSWIARLTVHRVLHRPARDWWALSRFIFKCRSSFA